MLHLVGFLLILNYDARNHEVKKMRQSYFTFLLTMRNFVFHQKKWTLDCVSGV